MSKIRGTAIDPATFCFNLYHYKYKQNVSTEKNKKDIDKEYKNLP